MEKNEISYKKRTHKTVKMEVSDSESSSSDSESLDAEALKAQCTYLQNELRRQDAILQDRIRTFLNHTSMEDLQRIMDVLKSD